VHWLNLPVMKKKKKARLELVAAYLGLYLITPLSVLCALIALHVATVLAGAIAVGLVLLFAAFQLVYLVGIRDGTDRDASAK
jgi:hypothetical protein